MIFWSFWENILIMSDIQHSIIWKRMSFWHMFTGTEIKFVIFVTPCISLLQFFNMRFSSVFGNMEFVINFFVINDSRLFTAVRLRKNRLCDICVFINKYNYIVEMKVNNNNDLISRLLSTVVLIKNIEFNCFDETW